MGKKGKKKKDAVIIEPKKRKVKSYAHCAPCKKEQPMIAKYCCVCGSHNKN